MSPVCRDESRVQCEKRSRLRRQQQGVYVVEKRNGVENQRKKVRHRFEERTKFYVYIPPPRMRRANAYNWFPIHPLPANSLLREIFLPPVISTIVQGQAKGTYTLCGGQNHCIVISVPPFLNELVASVKSWLIYEAGALNYNCQITPLITPNFTNPFLSPYDEHCHNSPLPPCQSCQNMNIIYWNVCGCGSFDFRRIFREVMLMNQLDLVFLTETRLSGERANQIIPTLGFDRYIKVDAMGFAGGMWLLWNP
ncbi:reverse transcriptase [Senna tora]|uniref:Reverse transcriptase n=1 Tax=Senna tora TaxID=362788 RepID=A0A834XFR9_9FABA|nr:reverse transcriptase [Senna tora]